MQAFWNNQACKRKSLVNSSLILSKEVTIFMISSAF
ncbi:hypothetical protein N9414_10143 [Nodularia spumigena CCY9414]|nr:hypothetical protein N9414_10143 [Nodularia spumigena CCY9414]